MDTLSPASVSITSATLESHSAFNKVQEVRALFNASAGVELVKHEVETGLSAGRSLYQVLDNLSVSPPTADLEFDTIDTFRILVPERIFEFTSIGRSGGAEVTVSVQFRRREILHAGVFGVDEVRTQPGVSIYGYNSREISSPTPADDNGGGTVGSNDRVDFGNHLTFEGTVLLGETEAGGTASCVGCYGVDTENIGHVDPDPLGANNNGQLAQTFEQVRLSNDNALNPAISGTVFSTRPGGTSG